MKAELNIYAALNKLEAFKGERISDNQVAKAMGVHRHTVASIRQGREERLLSKLLDFFKSEGMPVTLSDLFDVTDD